MSLSRGLKRLCCPCCINSGARQYLRIIDGGRCPLTQQLLDNVETFVAFDCVKFLYVLQREGESSSSSSTHAWIPSICSRLLEIFYDNPADVEFHSRQIFLLLVAHDRCMPLEVAILHMCARSLHFALLLYWFLIAEVEDSGKDDGLVRPRLSNMLLCVMASAAKRHKNGGSNTQGFESPEQLLAQLALGGDGIDPSLVAEEGGQGVSKARLLEWVRAQLREEKGFVQQEVAFVDRLTGIAETLRCEAPQNRQEVLSFELASLNDSLGREGSSGPSSSSSSAARGAGLNLCVPFAPSPSTFRRVVRIPPEHAKAISTATRCPFMICVETLATIRKVSAPDLDPVQRLNRYVKEISFKAQVVRDGVMPSISLSRFSIGKANGSNGQDSRHASSHQQTTVPLIRTEEAAVSKSQSEVSRVEARQWMRTYMASPPLPPSTWGGGELVGSLGGGGAGASRDVGWGDEARGEGYASFQSGDVRSDADAVSAMGARSDVDAVSAMGARSDADAVSAMGAHPSASFDSEGLSPDRGGGGGGRRSLEVTDELSPPLTPQQDRHAEGVARTLHEVSRIGVSTMPDQDSFEPWSSRRARMREASPYARALGWGVELLIVKSADDVRQEAFAMQLIECLERVWKKGKVNVKGVTDALSLDSIKKRPGYTSLLQLFRDRYGNGDKFRKAQLNFARSLAGYSAICYILQVKDRHNGNILLSSSGHLVHIDFGFILGMSPGNLAFERSPFKVTEEYIELMGGRDSKTFETFRGLCVAAFLEARRHFHRVAALVEITSLSTTMPCFPPQNASRVLEGLITRMDLGLSPAAFADKIRLMIDASSRSWSTKQYDRYQEIVNGIAP